MAKKTASATNYQQMSAQLAELLAWFESEAVNLDEAIVKYDQAVKLINDMEKYLKAAENKVKKIKLGRT